MMTHLPYKSIVFDLDGTLLDTWPALFAAVRSCWPDCGPGEAATLRTVMSRGIDAVFERAAGLMGGDAARAAQVQAQMQRSYSRHGVVSSVPYSGATEVLRHLSACGYDLGVCTNRDRTSAQALLRQSGWEGVFRHMVCLHDCSYPKPHAQPLLTTLALLNCVPGHALFVGDSGIDAQCAAHAGVDFAAHLQGYHGSASELQPRLLGFNQLSELADWLVQQT